MAIAMIFTVILAQLLRVQGLDASTVSAQAFSERAQRTTIPALRGQIVDAGGTTLARSVERRNVTADPFAASEYKVRDKQTGKRTKVGLKGAAQAIAPIVGADATELLSALQQTADKKRRFMYLVKDISPDQWNRINDLRIPGIFSERVVKREYPQGTAAAPLVGWVSADGTPGGGIEAVQQKVLNGKPGVHIYERAPDGTVIATASNSDTPAVDGRPVQLTIDNDLQWTAQNLIAAATTKAKAASGEAVVLDLKGNVLAAASYPSFDNNQIAAAKGSLLARPFTEVYEPGSTGKVITMAAALQEGKVSATSPFSVPYSFTRNGEKFADSHTHPTETMTTAGILAKSSNTGTIMVGEKMSPQTMVSYMKKFGLGASTGVRMPGESAGFVKPAQSWVGRDRYVPLFGQGVSSNTMQLAGVFQTIANGGVREPIKLIKGVGDGSGNFAPPQDDRVAVQAVTPQVATQVTRMLNAVATEDGTAPKAAVPGYNVAGKTGTAQRYSGSQQDGVTASFIGFAPSEAPRYIVAVAVHKPQAGTYGGELAAPVFSQLMQAALRLGHVPPSSAKPQLYDLVYDPKKGKQ
ncbi:penicillin-binding protein 2 [Yimella sp. cx-51]|uniref:peptidoglycan D,D-transpeptidase FtsI family protein n=1 Tax=Yimella sp. cx-51 TaxID=2770551 RepID=UPI00165E337F|nr:penicillin-binding protein 2 [Yimella sp. cx-51]MBC9957267.1 penicillin-binding protein 2 [Yimella sp. cx-51]QTH37094.1 penicillin-binding protein 2 [Yimella sp. cx-51]